MKIEEKLHNFIFSIYLSCFLFELQALLFRFNFQQIQKGSSRHWRLHDTKSPNSNTGPRIGSGRFGEELWQVSWQFSSGLGKSATDIAVIQECYVKER